MSEKQVGRLIYIEPNDIPKETLNTSNGIEKSISNITWNPEDLNIYVDLQVICPKRTDCGNDPFDNGNLNSKNDLNERKYISLLEGIKLNKNDKFGSLTTNYTNISYSEILNSSSSDREALGISSIDITFDAHFYPRVTINFVDIHGYSLFMSAEEVYETELRNEGARSEETKDLYEATNRAYSHFFSSVFHFPYPRFILTVKGVYGTKVSFILAVDTFKSSLNSHTGNFDVVITFIGYMYGLYTDIPMTYLLIAPYIEPFSETPDENGLIRSKYWEECGFKSAEDTPLPTFLEFLEKYRTVLLQLRSNQIDLGSDTEEYNNIQQFVSSLDEIIKDSDELFNSVSATTGRQVGPNPIKPSKDNTFNFYKLFTKSDTDTSVTLEWNNDLALKLYNKIENTKSTYATFLDTNTISQNVITQFYGQTDRIVENKMTLSTKLSDVTDEIYFNTNGTTVELTITSDDKEFLKNTNNNGNTPLDACYIFGMDIQKTKTKLTELIKESKNELNQLYKKASDNAAEVFEDAMGFRMSIENIYRMIFAHLQCFFHEYIDNTITEIATDTSVKRCIDSDFGISLEDTDIDSKDENPKAPPFFALYEEYDGDQKTLAYPGTSSYGKPALTTIHEVTLVDKLLNAAKLYRENFDAIRSKIEGLTIELNSGEGEDDPSFTTNAAAITTFNPICVYEVLFGDTNPYLHLSDDADIHSILYHAGLRLYIAERLGYIKKARENMYNAIHTNYKTINSDIIDAEVENILKIFPTLDTRNYTETEFDNIVEDKIFDYGYMYKCISENTSLFNVLATSQFNTMDTSLVTDEARRNILNNHKTEFIKYINDNVLYYDDSVFSKFTNTFNNKIKGKIQRPEDAFTSFDSTGEIREASDTISRETLNKLYKVETNKGKDEYRGIYNQLPTSKLDEYTVPFLIWESDNKLVNMFESPSFQKIEKEVQAFFILLSMVVSELSELITNNRAYDLCNVQVTNNEITYYIHARCKCLKIRFVTALFFGALEYAHKHEALFAKYGILTRDTFGYKLNEHLFKHKKNTYLVVRTFKSTLNGENWQHSPITTFEDTSLGHPTSECIDKFYSNFLQGDTVLLNLFEKNVNTTGNLLNNILSNYVNDLDKNSFKFEKDKYATQLRTRSDGYQEADFEGMKFLNKGCNTSKNLVDLLVKTCTLIFTDAYTNYSPKSNITDTESFKTYFKKTYIDPIIAKLGNTEGESTDNTETTNNDESSNTKASDSNDLKKSLYYTLKNLYDKWICSYGNMNRFKLPSTYQEEKNNKEKKYANGEKVDSISEINNFIFVDAFYRDISNDFLVNPDTIVEIIEQTLLSRQFNFSVYQFMALLCEKNKLLFRALPVYNNFTDTDSLKNIFRPNNLFNHQTPQENNFSPTYLIMYTHQPSAHLNISTKKGINYRDDGLDLAGTIAPKHFERCDDGEHINYIVPAFGVTYGMQNQNYFKSININMDNPITTDYAILNQLQLAERAVSGDLQHPIGIGQNIYSIYSNRSYNCTVEMLGCANIMPMMYFQLNNIPMFKGAYMIVSVKHSIKNGSMTTIFTGVRQSSALQAFTTNSYLLSKIVDAVNGNGGSYTGFYSGAGTSNNTGPDTGFEANRSTNCGTYDLSWADNITL